MALHSAWFRMPRMLAVKPRALSQLLQAYPPRPAWKQFREAHARAESTQERMRFTPSTTVHPIFQRRDDESIWLSKDIRPKSGDLITHLKSTLWIDIVSPEIRRSLDAHAMHSDADPANYLVGWSGILRRLFPSCYGYIVQWEVVAPNRVPFARLIVSKRDRYGTERVLLFLRAHANYAGFEDKDFTQWRIGFLESDIQRWTDEVMNKGEAGERLPWIGAMGHRFILGVKDKDAGLNRIGDESNTIFDVYSNSSKKVLLDLVKTVENLPRADHQLYFYGPSRRNSNGTLSLA